MDEKEMINPRELIHALRGPITVINGFLGAIKNLPMNERQKEYYEAAVRSGERILEVVSGSTYANRSSAVS